MSENDQTSLRILGVRFRDRGKVYSFDATNLDLKKGESVIVNTESGLAMGVVATAISVSPNNKLPDNLQKVVRRATEEDLKIHEGNLKTEKEALQFCMERVKSRGLSMKLVNVKALFDKSKLVFYFTAESRVDFRDLVKDLVQKYKTRIELRQIWVRSEARTYGGIGMCGRELCCSSFLNNFELVSIKMAKEQNMLLNPEKISGLCGRLMCCLAFEHENYVQAKKNMPKCGKIVTTAEGTGKVVKQNVLEEMVVVDLGNGKEVEVPVNETQLKNGKLKSPAKNQG